MKYVDEFRDPALGRRLVAEIEALVERAGGTAARPLKLMEVCGGHTHAIFKFGLDELLPPGIELVHGPGCPVCVLPVGRVDDAIAIARTPGVVFATFGDAMRVPGSTLSLLQARAQGADVRTVYSPTDALRLAVEHPDRQVVFFGLGFETTAPSTALTIREAAAAGVDNFSVFSNHITIVPTIKALNDKMTTIVELECNRTLSHLPHLEPADRAAIQRMTRAIASRAIHDPILFLRNTGDHRDDTHYLDVARLLFNLDLSGDE